MADGSSPILKRILLKISGESFGTDEPFQLARVADIVAQMAELHREGVQLGVVMGGGNIIRGSALEQKGIPRETGDAMGMLATVINAMVLSELLEAKGIPNRIITTRTVEGVGECYQLSRSLKYLEDGNLLLFAGGTGHPYFTTDTAAALRAVEMRAQCLLKGTKVDGVYSGEDIARSQKFDRLTYQEVLEKRYRVMDLTAVAFCMDNHIPIRVFNLMKLENLRRVVYGENVGTLICE